MTDTTEVPAAPPPEPLLKFFRFAHLPFFLQKASEPYCVLAHQLVQMLPGSAERTVALRKLIESKDCAVRALLEHLETNPPPHPTSTGQ